MLNEELLQISERHCHISVIEVNHRIFIVIYGTKHCHLLVGDGTVLNLGTDVCKLLLDVRTVVRYA